LHNLNHAAAAAARAVASLGYFSSTKIKILYLWISQHPFCIQEHAFQSLAYPQYKHTDKYTNTSLLSFTQKLFCQVSKQWIVN